MHGAHAEEPDDARRAVERAEHERDAPVLAQVADRLDAAARQVLVPHARRREDMEGVADAFRGDVDVRLGAERGGGDPEYLLLEDPWGELLGDGVVEFAHDGGEGIQADVKFKLTFSRKYRGG